jgi:hypothetical protein
MTAERHMKNILFLCLGLIVTVSCSDAGKSSLTSKTFYDEYNKPLAATCYASGNVSANGRTVTVRIYVDNAFPSADAATAAASVLSNFAGNGGSESIYGWITNIFGSEWGADAAQLYPESLIGDDKTITILMYDIDGDQATNTAGPWVVGFFFARDNYLKKSNTYSNESLMFYLDLPYYLRVSSSETAWSSSGYYPKAIYSALAHEFQHMINFYQKNILRNSFSDAWFNEMCSVAAEDFVADKIGVQGPRGVLDVNSVASIGTTNGRLPLFNYDNTHSLVVWNPDMSVVLDNYSLVYAFGSYLARNHGGAPLFTKFVQSTTPLVAGVYDCKAGMVDAVNSLGGGSETLESLLRQWGAAVVLSDSSNGLPPKAQYNTGSSIKTLSGEVTYNLGPINLYNYKYVKNNVSYVGPSCGSLSGMIYSIVTNFAASLSPVTMETTSISGSPYITEYNTKLQYLQLHDSPPDSKAEKAKVSRPSSSLDYNTTGVWDLSTNTAANQVTYLSAGTSTLTVTLGSTTRDLYLVFSNPATTDVAIPQVNGTSLTLNGLYSSMQMVSNAYYRIGYTTGTYTASLIVPSGVVVTVVAK